MKLKQPLKFTGKGDSFWGESKGTYLVDKIYVNYLDIYPSNTKSIFGEVRMYGKNTAWVQYTDNGIRKAINTPKVLSIVKKLLIENGLKNVSNLKLDWSEQGMQPENGWSFDLVGKCKCDSKEDYNIKVKDPAPHYSISNIKG